MLDKVKPSFEEGGKLHKYFPVYDSIDTFLFTPNHVTKNGTHIKDGIDLKRTMFMVILALVPCLLFGMWNVGHQHALAIGQEVGMGEAIWGKFFYGALRVLPFVIVSYAVGLGVEFIICIKKKHPINEGFLVSGMLIPLIMPIDCPLWMVAVATAFAVLFGKEVFGGTGMNIVNVALTARAFVFFAYPTKISGSKVWTRVARDGDGNAIDVATHYNAGEVVVAADTVPGGADAILATVDGVYNAQGVLLEGVDAFTGETPLGNLANASSNLKELGAAIDAHDSPEVISELTTNIANYMEAVPDWSESLIGTISGSIGETSVIACLLGAGLLLMTKVASWRVMLSFLIGGLTMGLIFNLLAEYAGVMVDGELMAHPFLAIPAWEQLLMGGFMFGLVFMATDPVTAAQTTKGKWIYGFFAGFFAIAIRVFNPAYPEGVMMAILFMNVMAPLIDHYVIAGNIKRREARWKLKSSSAH